MASWYRVIYWTPGTNDERINVGVMAFDHNTVLVRGLKDWSRFKAFCGVDYDLADSVAEYGTWTVQQAKARENHYMSSLRIDAPRASILGVETTLARMSDTMLVEPAR